MVGREGMLGVQAVLGYETIPFRAMVQGEGRAWQVTRHQRGDEGRDGGQGHHVSQGAIDGLPGLVIVLADLGQS